MAHTLTLRAIEPVTHDTHHLVFERPEGFAFEPGQAIEMKLQKDGWRDEGRPFTPISQPDEETLEFVIKSYPSHDGVTEQIAKLQPGDEVSIEGPFGDIRDKGPGVFIAGGAGITPMIALLRKRLADNGTLKGSTLVFSNKTEDDIILREQLSAMPGLTVAFVVSDGPGDTVPKRKLDRDYLRQFIEPGTLCYLCGPPPMMDVQAELDALGVDPGDVVADDWS
ncbi:flavodoxin reductase [Pelagivirga sediminicola]|uniref:Flavodoxin reductase n=1 Tax=Pelagivirga sediminicola TaxID=2170575 RepID=A0A2T7G444_9RHOB|nr:FAD-binding oxidoreductase [Pelagivirga sediminicola]PVA09185.1 flavodoxin reductase [Pelagivirga sediminicola]